MNGSEEDIKKTVGTEMQLSSMFADFSFHKLLNHEFVPFRPQEYHVNGIDEAHNIIG